MCSLSCIGTMHVLGTATGENIAMYSIYMMAPSTVTLAAHHVFYIWMLEWEVQVWFKLQVHTSTPVKTCSGGIWRDMQETESRAYQCHFISFWTEVEISMEI